MVERSNNCMFNTSVFLVDKQDGFKRVVLDYREVNENILPYNLELPSMSDLLNNLANNIYVYYVSTDSI